MAYLPFIALIAIIIIAGLTISSKKLNKKLASRLQNSFGKPPVQTDYELNSIDSYYCHKKPHMDHEHSIDDITWNDLDMDKIFKRMNVCLTSVGEEYLYAALHEPNFTGETLLKREELISYMSKHPEERLELQMILSKLGKSDHNGVSSFIFNADTKTLKHPQLYNILALISLLCTSLIFVNVSAGVISLIASIIANGIVYYITKLRIDRELSAIEYFSYMLWSCTKINKMKALESLPFFHELREKYAPFKSFRGRTSGLLKRTFSDFDFMIVYGKIALLSDIRKYNKAVRTICEHADDFHALYKSLGELDMAICILSFRESLPFYARPQFRSENSIAFQELYHPLLSEPVSNSGTIKNDSIMTGSNASGKSTFIKALAVNGILAQTVYTCTAKAFALRFSLVITSMAVRENITSGDSYFVTEIKSLKRILDRIQTVPCTCFIDEILRGTNTVERIAASAAVLHNLHDTGSLCIAASHDIELTDILSEQYDNYHFCEQIADDGIYFDYTLKLGASQTRNAISLLKYIEYDSQIVANAEKLVDKYMTSKTWR